MKQYKLSPFCIDGMWTFNTPIEYNLPTRSLHDNQLVAGADNLLENVFNNVGNFDILISDYQSDEYINANPRLTIQLKWIDGNATDKNEWNTYKNVLTHEQCDLCPVLFDYWNPVPKYIYITILPK